VSERKPAGVTWESWTERLIEEGRRAGAFEGLEGTGKPIDGLDGPHDEEWWVKAKLRREQIDALPPALAIRGERDTAVAAALESRDESEARHILEQINERIRYVNSHTVSGPPSTVWVVDIEAILDRWRETHPAPPVDDRLETARGDLEVATSRGRRRVRRWRR
jgi:hypothetical protein